MLWSSSSTEANSADSEPRTPADMGQPGVTEQWHRTLEVPALRRACRKLSEAHTACPLLQRHQRRLPCRHRPANGVNICTVQLHSCRICIVVTCTTTRYRQQARLPGASRLPRKSLVILVSSDSEKACLGQGSEHGKLQLRSTFAFVPRYFIIPVGASSFKDAMRIGSECYHTLKGIIKKKPPALF